MSKINLDSPVGQHWLKGEWDVLAAFSDKLAISDTTGERALLKGASLAYAGDVLGARKYFQIAKNCGCTQLDIARVLTSGAHSALGRIFALKGDLDTARHQFEQALRIAGCKRAKVSEKLQTRCVRELSSLGLLEEAGKQLRANIVSLRGHGPSVKMDRRISMLESEIATLEAVLVNQLGTQSLLRRVNGKPKTASYSQLGQDRWVLEKLKDKRGGYFVEFGASDGVLLSNTLVLEQEYGWRGLLAEPNPQYFESLKNYRSCTISSACISGCSGEIVDFVLAKEYGGIRDHMYKDKHAARRQAYADEGKIIQLQTTSLEDFLLSNDAPREIDYLSMDTEGSEFEILRNFPISDWTIHCITVEHNNGVNREPIRRLLSDAGYVFESVKWDDWFYKPSA